MLQIIAPSKIVKSVGCGKCRLKSQYHADHG
jgi:hypothetical protein